MVTTELVVELGAMTVEVKCYRVLRSYGRAIEGFGVLRDAVRMRTSDLVAEA